MIEALTQARDCAEFTHGNLRAALGKASAVESLILLPLIADAAKLRQQVEVLLAAVESAE
jgi:hypothetical protein